jgi:general secretion pathway protein E
VTTQARADRARLLGFLHGLSGLVHGGMALPEALTLLEACATDRQWRAALAGLRATVEKGDRLHRGMRELPDLFPTLLCALVGRGEVFGRLGPALDGGAAYLIRELRLPPEGAEASAARTLSLWCRRFDLLWQTGATILEALEVSVEDLPTDDPLREAVLFLRQAAREGARLSETMVQFPEVFPPIARQYFAVGEAGGGLGEMAGRLAETLDALGAECVRAPRAGADPGVGRPTSAPLPEESFGRVQEMEPVAAAAPSAAPDRAREEVEALLREAIAVGASDVHFQSFTRESLTREEPEAMGDVLRVRVRVDGALRELRIYEGGAGRPLVARLKSMARLDAGTLRLPRRGALSLGVPETGETRFLRVQTYPCAEGLEAIEVRVPSPSASARLTDLGMTEEQAATCRRLLGASHGILAVAGSRGSGRTTTLLTLLEEMRAAGLAEGRSIVTIERPAQTRLDGVVQVSLDASVPLTVAAALRGALAQDPDCLLVDEVEDAEAAAEAVRAAGRGRLLLVAVAARDGESARRRLLGASAPPAAGPLLAVVLQRLVPVPCPTCAGDGCDACDGRGSRGRTGRFEIL